MHGKANQLLHKVQLIFFRFAMWLEVVVSIVIFAGVLYHLAAVPSLFIEKGGLEFNSFLQYLLEGLIGLEVIMMLCRHDLDSIVEVMIFAVTKTLLILHENSAGMLVGVLAVAVLFAIRKFLFLSSGELSERKRHSDYIQRDH